MLEVKDLEKNLNFEQVPLRALIGDLFEIEKKISKPCSFSHTRNQRANGSINKFQICQIRISL